MSSSIKTILLNEQWIPVCFGALLVWSVVFTSVITSMHRCTPTELAAHSGESIHRNPQFQFKQQVYNFTGRYIYAPTRARNAAGLNRTNAICISGSRVHKLLLPQVAEAFKTLVLQNNNPDIFIYAFYDFEKDGPFNITQLMELYGEWIVGFHIKGWDEVEQQRLEVLKMHHGIHIIQASLFANIHDCHHGLLRPYYMNIRGGRKYDVIMRARPDMIYQNAVDMSLYQLPASEMKIYTPPSHNSWKPGDPVSQQPWDPENGILLWGGMQGINDQCYLGSHFTMDLYTSVIYSWIHEFGNRAGPELNLYSYSERFHLAIKRANFRYDLVR